jgi:hypothetical protein
VIVEDDPAAGAVADAVACMSLAQQPDGGMLPQNPGWQPGVAYSPLGEAERRINVHFRVGYMTQWGQRLVLAGSGACERARVSVCAARAPPQSAAAAADAALRARRFHRARLERQHTHTTSSPQRP